MVAYFLSGAAVFMFGVLVGAGMVNNTINNVYKLDHKSEEKKL